MSVKEFIDREAELDGLERAWHARDAQLVILTGRRRVGKSALLTRFARGKPIAYVVAAQRLPADQLVDAGHDIAPLAHDFSPGRAPAVRLERWEDLLDILTDRSATRRVGLILDELPYLVAQSPELPSLIQRWWDRTGSRSNLMLILAGSHQSVMEQLTSSSGALFGRATWRRQLEPFDYFDAAAFVRSWDPVDRVRAFAVTGGVPAYLRQLDASRTLRANLADLAFTPDGPLFRDAEYLFDAEFREVSRRGSIFRAMARGATRPSEIAQAIGLRDAADVQANLRDLTALGLVERVVPITDELKLRQRHVLYRIKDPYLRFYFTLVDPRRARIQIGPPEAVVAEIGDTELDEHVSHVFEDVCSQYVWRSIAAGELPSVERLGRWWRSQDEVDLAGLSRGRLSLAAEVKWQRQPMDDRDLRLLRDRVRLLDAEADPELLLVSRSGFHASLRRQAGVRLIGIRDMYASRLGRRGHRMSAASTKG